jgi:hypothetical protein
VGRLAAAVLIAFAVLLPSAAEAALPCKPWQMRSLATGMGSLENVLADGSGGLLISASDQNAIVRMTPDGQYAPLVPGVTAPGGMRISDGILYFNTGDALQSGVAGTADGTLESYNLATHTRTVFAGGLVMPNGLAMLPNGDFVTSRDVGSGTGITRVPRGDPAHPQTSWVKTSDSNGMAVDPTGQWLYFVETFTAASNVYRVKIADPKQVEVVAALGNTVPPKGLDDMTIDGSGVLYIAANGAGELIRLDPRDKSVCVIASGMMNTSAVKFGAGPGWPETNLYVVGFDGVVRELKPPPDQLPVPVSTAPPAKPPVAVRAIRLTASPKSLRRGHRRCITFHATSGGDAVGGARIRFAGRTATADFGGRARICVKPRRAGSLTATASKPGHRAGRLRIHVLA